MLNSTGPSFGVIDRHPVSVEYATAYVLLPEFFGQVVRQVPAAPSQGAHASLYPRLG